jgi:hypothetical protein
LIRQDPLRPHHLRIGCIGWLEDETAAPALHWHTDTQLLVPGHVHLERLRQKPAAPAISSTFGSELGCVVVWFDLWRAWISEMRAGCGFYRQRLHESTPRSRRLRAVAMPCQPAVQIWNKRRLPCLGGLVLQIFNKFGWWNKSKIHDSTIFLVLCRQNAFRNAFPWSLA